MAVGKTMAIAALVMLCLATTVYASCPNSCSKMGLCNKYSQCECNTGYTGGDCSLRTCKFGASWNDMAYGNEVAHAQVECSDKGLCDRTNGECSCMEGFTGAACDQLACNMNCNNNGRCYTMHELAVQTRDSTSAQYTYDTEFGAYGVWDANKIKGCVCDPLFDGYDCSTKTCVRGDDPLTTSQVNEVQLLTCIATTGNFVVYYDGKPSGTIPFDASAATFKEKILQIRELTDVDVTFSVPGLLACQINTNVIKIEFNAQFGKQSPLIVVMDAAMTGVGAVTVYSNAITSVVDFAGATHISVHGTKESDICAGRGLCMVADGTCVCFDTNGDTYGSSNGYGAVGSRGDCGFITSGSTVSSCPGQISCSGHGLCDDGTGSSTFKCSCNEGWGGGDCSERLCPVGLTWFDYPSANNKAHFTYSTCSNQGICDLGRGACACREGFYGEACQYMACGGGVAAPCNNRGKCLSMRELALWREDNGDATSFTYGLDPNEARTWDADLIHGCLCDKGFEGYDCSQRTCPKGDDPATHNQHVEVQLLQCDATEGKFTLSFRQETTYALSWNATANEVRDALMSLSTLREGGVTWQKSSIHSPNQLEPYRVENGETFEEYTFPIRVYMALDNDRPYGVIEHQEPDRIDPAGDPVDYVHNANSTVRAAVQTAFCRTDGTQHAVIVFDAIHGDLPAITADVSDLRKVVIVTETPGTIAVFQDGANIGDVKSVKGTTENVECNNRGICNKESGRCECFNDWSSSDGKGNSGYIGDCGFRNDLKYSFSNSFVEAKMGIQNANPDMVVAN